MQECNQNYAGIAFQVRMADELLRYIDSSMADVSKCVGFGFYYKETLWDFADAFREYGFIDAIYITGGADYVSPYGEEFPKPWPCQDFLVPLQAI